jgi:AcrR family transcriptional regulator
MTVTPMTANPSTDGYHHGDLRRALMSAARSRIAAVGTEALSMRSLCRELGVSATAPYRHFPTKNSLLAAIAEDGFVQLGDAVSTAISRAGDDPLAQLVNLGEAYVRFAVANPVDYHLMFGSVLLDFSAYTELMAAADRCFGEVIGVLQRGVAAGAFRDDPIELLAGTAWAAVHGIASLLIDKSKQDAARETAGAMRAIGALGEHTRAAIRLLVGGLLR